MCPPPLPSRNVIQVVAGVLCRMSELRSINSSSPSSGKLRNRQWTIRDACAYVRHLEKRKMFASGTSRFEERILIEGQSRRERAIVTLNSKPIFESSFEFFQNSDFHMQMCHFKPTCTPLRTPHVRELSSANDNGMIN